MSYAAIANRVLDTIRRKGADIVFHGTSTPEVYDPLTGDWTGGETVADVTGKAMQINGDPDRMVALKLVLKNPVSLMVAAKGLSIVPAPGGRFTWGGTGYTIEDSDPFGPAGTPIYWTIVGGI